MLAPAEVSRHRALRQRCRSNISSPCAVTGIYGLGHPASPHLSRALQAPVSDREARHVTGRNWLVSQNDVE